MAKTYPFNQYPEEYDGWYDAHPRAFEAELAAIRQLLPEAGVGLEVGVGSGRFAAALNIRFSVEPSRAMRSIAQQRGLEVTYGVAEALPFPDQQFDYVLFIATACFLDSLDQSNAGSLARA